MFMEVWKLERFIFAVPLADLLAPVLDHLPHAVIRGDVAGGKRFTMQILVGSCGSDGIF